MAGDFAVCNVLSLRRSIKKKGWFSKMKTKRIISLLAATAMTVTALTGAMSVSVVSAADDYLTSGTIGDNASWFINSDSNLIISGTGDIEKPSGGWGWEKLKNDINEVIVEDGITVASDTRSSIFSSLYMPNVTKITLPPSLTKFNRCFDPGAGDNYPCLKDIYVYSRNVSDASSFYDSYMSNPWAGSGKIWHVFKDSETDKSLRNDLKLTDDDIEYIPDGEQMPSVTNREPVKLEPLNDTSGPAGLFSKWEWNDSSNTLTFSGKGTISIADDYKKYANTTKHIVIEEGIVSINATKGYIPNKDTNAGAFYEFTALNDVKLPDSLQKIGDATFYQTPLISVNLPSTLESIGKWAFTETNIEEITFPENLNTIGVSAFQGTKIKSINLHEGMTIGGHAFSDCKSLEEVTIPKNIKFLRSATGGAGMAREHGTFSSCTGLQKIIIKNGCQITDPFMNVQSQNGLGEQFCQDCTSLKTVIIMGNVDYIPTNTFNGCSSLDDIYFYNTGLNNIMEKGYGTDGNQQSIDPTNNPTFHVVKGSTTEQTLKDAGYLTADNTVYLPDTTALETAISEVEDIDTSKYTDESLSALTKAIENAKAVLENLDATQDEVDSAVKAIEDAKNALTDKSGEPSSDNTSDPSNSSGNNNQSQSPNTPATPSTSAPTTATPKPTTPPTVTTTAAKPAKVKAVKLKAKKKKLNVSWKKVSGATGYEVMSATNNKFTKNKKTVTVKKNKVTIKKLKPKKKYFVKVRAYKLASGRKYFGKWSKVVKKKVR